jgi:hypothetical protein
VKKATQESVIHPANRACKNNAVNHTPGDLQELAELSDRILRPIKLQGDETGHDIENEIGEVFDRVSHASYGHQSLPVFCEPV